MIYLSVLFCIVIVILIYNSDKSINHEVHEIMVKKNCDIYGYGCWDSFIRNFDKQTWVRQKEFPNSLFCDGTNSKIHASIIKFEGIGMILNKEDYKKHKKFIKKKLKDMPFSNTTSLYDWGCAK